MKSVVKNFVLHDVERIMPAEIASALGIDIETSQADLHRAADARAKPTLSLEESFRR